MRTPELWGVYSSMHCWAQEVGITPWSFRFPCKWSAQWRGEIPDLFQEQYLLWKWCSVLNSVKRLTHIQFYDITVRLKTSKWRYWRWIYRSFKVSVLITSCSRSELCTPVKTTDVWRAVIKQCYHWVETPEKTKSCTTKFILRRMRCTLLEQTNNLY